MSVACPVFASAPCPKSCCVRVMRTPLPVPEPPAVAPSMSANTARDCLKPIVLVFATLSPVTASAPASAVRPETPAYMARRMLIVLSP